MFFSYFLHSAIVRPPPDLVPASLPVVYQGCFILFPIKDISGASLPYKPHRCSCNYPIHAFRPPACLALSHPVLIYPHLSIIFWLFLSTFCFNCTVSYHSLLLRSFHDAEPLQHSTNYVSVISYYVISPHTIHCQPVLSFQCIDCLFSYFQPIALTHAHHSRNCPLRASPFSSPQTLSLSFHTLLCDQNPCSFYLNPNRTYHIKIYTQISKLYHLFQCFAIHDYLSAVLTLIFTKPRHCILPH